MKTFVLILGIWINTDNIVYFEDAYLTSTGIPYCGIHLNINNTNRILMVEHETCDEVIRDVTNQLEDPN